MPNEPSFQLAGKRVLVAGHRGMVGSALVRRLEQEDCDIQTAGRSEVDFRRQAETERWMSDARPDAVFVAAAKVGGILANDTYPAEFLYDNLMIEANILEAAHRADVAKVVVLGSSCIYPKFAPNPITEDALLTGALEPTNEWYAIAKIAGIKLAQAYRKQHGRDFISAMPTNLYGPGDQFDLNTSHVVPALMLKAHRAKIKGAKSFVIWGSGTPRREFLHVDDCAAALVLLMRDYSGHEHVNVGSGTDLSIMELAECIARIVGFKGDIIRDTTKPDGVPSKLMSSAKLHRMGWSAAIDLETGLRSTYQWFLQASAMRGSAKLDRFAPPP